MTEMALDETGWTGWGKGGVKHLTERRMYLSALVEISRQVVDYKVLCRKGIIVDLSLHLFYSELDNHRKVYIDYE